MGNNVYSVKSYGGWKGRGWEDTEESMRKHSDNWVEWFEKNSAQITSIFSI